MTDVMTRDDSIKKYRDARRLDQIAAERLRAGTITHEERYHAFLNMDMAGLGLTEEERRSVWAQDAPSTAS